MFFRWRHHGGARRFAPAVRNSAYIAIVDRMRRFSRTHCPITDKIIGPVIGGTLVSIRLC
jgi:hypothetical protein